VCFIKFILTFKGITKSPAQTVFLPYIFLAQLEEDYLHNISRLLIKPGLFEEDREYDLFEYNFDRIIIVNYSVTQFL
jgi:hypothetical protein